MSGGVQPPVAVETLVGTWTLERFAIAFSDDRPSVYPFGDDGQGLLIYAADGWMSAVLARRERVGLGTDRLENAARASDGAKVAAFDTYLSYAGRWRLEPDGRHVSHDVVQALTPELVGQTNRRRIVSADDERLVLSYEITPRSGTTRTYTLNWRRPR